MTDLVARLREAIDETERIAREADGGTWVVGPTFGGRDNRVYVKPEGYGIDTIGTCIIAGQVSNMPQYRANAQHIARHDPAAVLRRCVADRKILDLHEPGVSHPNECGRDSDPWPCDDVRALASVYIPQCGSQAVFWPDDEGCEAECIKPRGHEGTTHQDEILGEWTEDELPTRHREADRD